MALRPVALLTLALVAFGGAGCASMSPQEQEVMQGQIARIDERVAVMSKGARMQAELTADFASLRHSILTMTGQIEEFNARSQRLSERLDRMEKALAEMSQVYRSEVLERSAATDLRLDTLSRQLYDLSLQSLAFIDLMEKKNEIPPRTHQRKVDAMRGDAPTRETALTGDEDADTLYQRSYQFFLAGEYYKADEGFSRFVSRYANTTLADNAAYWVGESRYALKQYGPAADAFDLMASRYPQSPRAAAALERSATALLALGRTAEGIDRLRNLIALYPDSDEAVTAGQTLRSMGVGERAPKKPTPTTTPEPILTPVPDIPLDMPTVDAEETPAPTADDVATPTN